MGEQQGGRNELVAGWLVLEQDGHLVDSDLRRESAEIVAPIVMLLQLQLIGYEYRKTSVAAVPENPAFITT